MGTGGGCGEGRPDGNLIRGRLARRLIQKDFDLVGRIAFDGAAVTAREAQLVDRPAILANPERRNVDLLRSRWATSRPDEAIADQGNRRAGEQAKRDRHGREACEAALQRFREATEVDRHITRYDPTGLAGGSLRTE